MGINFLLPRLLPGDPITAIYGPEVHVQGNSQLKAELTQRFALDQPLAGQFITYIGNLAKGDLGYSFYYQAPVSEVLLSFLPWTLLLAGGALILSTAIGFILGVESGWNRAGKKDMTLLTGVMLLSGMPDFVVGTLLLLVFGLTLGWFPLAGAVTPYGGLSGLALVLDVLHHLALPLATLTIAGLTGTFMLTRNTMVTVLKAPFLLTARAKGLSPRLVRYRHAGRNALLPVVTGTGMRLGRLATGVLFVEVIFSYPGIGLLMHTALMARDYPIIQGVFLVVTLSVLTVSFLLDIIYTKLDPRVVYAP
ncbi:ABC transporter permease [Desulfofalx alkaliphila]|uniref:ABC transporter permease n=1 Tax=Desulfofalx alkaliphila TaxID=105483 RepID=UPI000A82D3B0|nr:ABC transporter permease [Desulfofalx alkaliphila]